MFVFPMAGASSRFSLAGYKQPKFMLPLHNTNLFRTVIRGFKNYFDHQFFLFVILEGMVDEKWIIENCRYEGLQSHNLRVISLARATHGQASTVYQALVDTRCKPDTELHIFNIDTVYAEFKLPEFYQEKNIAGFVDVIEAEGHHWSFVEPHLGNSTIGTVKRIVEKNRISNLCSTGFYNFKQAELFLSSYKKSKLKHSLKSRKQEKYVAPLYQNLIESGHNIFFRKLNKNDVTFCGTPEEYQSFCKTETDGNLCFF